MKTFIALMIAVFAVFCLPLSEAAKGFIIIGGLLLMALIYLFALAQFERKAEVRDYD